ncbi:unnamed protein product [Toxocara canis]|uniref:Pepsin inhibitor-3-like repeated domain-containing protein n=1 Tax=Toxocara canis TaxID=6265 RepID=A0A183UA47_TOXCA|nr:unnamed protein product [Toxocara canis]
MFIAQPRLYIVLVLCHATLSGYIPFHSYEREKYNPSIQDDFVYENGYRRPITAYERRLLNDYERNMLLYNENMIMNARRRDIFNDARILRWQMSAIANKEPSIQMPVPPCICSSCYQSARQIEPSVHMPMDMRLRESPLPQQQAEQGVPFSDTTTIPEDASITDAATAQLTTQSTTAVTFEEIGAEETTVIPFVTEHPKRRMFVERVGISGLHLISLSCGRMHCLAIVYKMRPRGEMTICCRQLLQSTTLTLS